MQELLQELVEKYGDQVFRLAFRYTGDRSRAEDLAQETFLKAYRNLDRLDRNREAGPWLFKIATNLCRNWLRDNRETPMENLEIVDSRVEDSPERIYCARESEQELVSALQDLPQIYREVLLLKHVNELSYAEICETLSLELSLVKNRLYRGRLMLKEKLAKGVRI